MAASTFFLSRFQIKIVRNQLDELWNTSQGGVILFIWMSFLMNDLLEHLSITSPLFVGADALTAVVDNDQVMRKNVRVYLQLFTIFNWLFKFRK